MSRDEFPRIRRRLLLAWLALLALLAASALTARLHLGAGNLLVSLGIAFVKFAIVAAVFMGLRERHLLPRIALVASLLALVVLGLLSGVDLWVRRDEATRWQPPQVLPRPGPQPEKAASSYIPAARLPT